jgi:hypothetical protein
MGHTRRQPPARQRTQPLPPPALAVAPHGKSTLTHARWVSSQEHAGMADLAANGDPGTR